MRVEGPEHHHLRRVARVRSGLVPEIRPPQNLEDYLRGEDSDLKLVLSEHGGTYL